MPKSCWWSRWALAAISERRFPVGPVHLGIVNQLGYSASVNGIELRGASFDYELSNGTSRNGGYIEGALASASMPDLAWRFFGSDVRFWGTNLFMDSYAEVGASMVGVKFGPMDFEVSTAYVFGRAYDSVTVRTKFRF